MMYFEDYTLENLDDYGAEELRKIIKKLDFICNKYNYDTEEYAFFSSLSYQLGKMLRFRKEDEMTYKNFEELKTKVEEWANDKDLLHEENAEKQFMKFMEEVFEFKSEFDYLERMGEDPSETYSDYEQIEIQENMQLEMGDIFVTLIILCKQLGIDCVECLQLAYDKISKRHGRTIDGIFVKEEDL